MAVTLADIHATQGYKELILLGCNDLGIATRSRRPELKINVEHKTLGIHSDSRGNHLGNYTIFQSGYVRCYTNTPIKVRGALDGDKNFVMNIKQWQERLNLIRNHIMRFIITGDMGISDATAGHIQANEKTLEDKFKYLISRRPNSFIKWLKTLESKHIEEILDLLNKEIVTLITSKPSQWAFTLKSIYKNPGIKRIIANLSPGVAHTFAGNLGLVGDLHDLGL